MRQDLPTVWKRGLSGRHEFKVTVQSRTGCLARRRAKKRGEFVIGQAGSGGQGRAAAPVLRCARRGEVRARS